MKIFNILKTYSAKESVITGVEEHRITRRAYKCQACNVYTNKPEDGCYKCQGEINYSKN